MSSEYWRWRFRDNPIGEPQILLALDGGTLAAHYAVCPMLIEIEGKPAKAALSGTTMTHPRYRGQGLFATLAERLYQQLAVSGYVMVCGFPNDQSHRGLVRDLKWQDTCEIPMFRLDSPGSIGGDHSGVNELVQLDASFDALWSKARPDAPIALRRDRKFLSWRLSPSSGKQYHLLRCKHGALTTGYAAYKAFQGEMDVVDIVTIPDSGAEAQLLSALSAICTEQKLTGMKLWMPLRNKQHLLLEKAGFHNSPPITYFAARVLAPIGVDASDSRNWHFSMLDSDVF